MTDNSTQAYVPGRELFGRIFSGGTIGNPGRRQPSDREPRRDEYDETGRRIRDYRSGGEDQPREERPREARERRDYRDADNDGLSNYHETEIYGTDPRDADTDNDGLPDGLEARWSWRDPNSFSDHRSDHDGDGLTDLREFHLGTDATARDSDGDGLGDRYEVSHGSDPTSWDTDGDGRGDVDELRQGTDPLTPQGDPAEPTSRPTDASETMTSVDSEEPVIVEPVTIFRPDLEEGAVGSSGDGGHGSNEPPVLEEIVDQAGGHESNEPPVLEEVVDQSGGHESEEPPVLEEIVDEADQHESEPSKLEELGCETLGFGDGHGEAPMQIEAPEAMQPAGELAFGEGADGRETVTADVTVPAIDPVDHSVEAESHSAASMPMMVETSEHQEMPEEEEEPPASILTDGIDEIGVDSADFSEALELLEA